MFKKIIHNLFCRPGKKKDLFSNKAITEYILNDLKENNSPSVFYKGIEYYDELVCLGYLPFYMYSPKNKLIMLYPIDYNYQTIKLPDYIKEWVSVTDDFIQFEIMDYIKYGDLDLDVLKFCNYGIKHQGKTIYWYSAKYKKDNMEVNIDVKEFITQWENDNSAVSADIPYVN